MRILSIILSSIALIGCATREPLGTDIKFHRQQTREEAVTVRLRWKAAPDPAFYTPRGPMTEISVFEHGKSASVPPSEFSSIEDIWPERIKLFSTEQGDYELIVPYGVGEGSTGIFRIRDFQSVPDAAPLDASNALFR